MNFNIIELPNQNIYLNKYSIIHISVAIPIQELKQDVIIKHQVGLTNNYLEWYLEKIKNCKKWNEYHEVIFDIYDDGFADKIKDITFDMDKWIKRKDSKWYSGIGEDNKRLE